MRQLQPTMQPARRSALALGLGLTLGMALPALCQTGASAPANGSAPAADSSTASAPAAAAPGAACTAWGERGALLHQDDFSGPLQGYVSEYPRTAGNVVASQAGRLLIDVDAGATVWLDKPLSGDLVIAYTRRVVLEGGKNDRLSDLNQFWMASDPARSTLFTRSGKLEDYDDLQLYYAGVGGNNNRTTRLRRYGQGQRQLVAERQGAAYMLEPNRDYQIEIQLYHGCTRLRIDGREIFSYRDPHPYTQGYFGFRTTWSRQTIAHFTIHQLK